MPVEYSVIVPDGVMRPILSLPFSANQRLPSGPAAMPLGLLPAVKPEKYSVYGNRFVGVIVPSASPPLGSVNQRLPSAPATMLWGPEPCLMKTSAPSEGSVGEIHPMRSPVISVYQRLPSGPTAMSWGPPPGVLLAEYSLTTKVVGAMRPIRLPLRSVNQRLPSGPAVMPT